MNSITDNLWISDIQSVRTMSVDADVVITVCQDRVDSNISCEYEYFNLADGPHSADYGGDCSYETFRKATDCVVEKLSEDKQVLVHCHVGQSRSAAVCMATLAVTDEISFNEAYTQVEKARPLVNPINLLEDYAKKYINKNT